MSNVLLINAHQPSNFSHGKLNASLVERAQELLGAKGHELRPGEVIAALGGIGTA